MKIVALITARGGSKGIPRKNIKLLAGKPLIAWTIQAAVESSIFDRIIVSTDDGNIAQICSEFGAEVPFMRPDKLAKDDSPHIEAVVHVDGTGRVQTVSKKLYNNFYLIIKSFYDLTGVPVIMNTSFNVKGQPIVETPEEAIKTFLSTKIEALLLGKYLIIK